MHLLSGLTNPAFILTHLIIYSSKVSFKERNLKFFKCNQSTKFSGQFRCKVSSFELNESKSLQSKGPSALKDKKNDVIYLKVTMYTAFIVTRYSKFARQLQTICSFELNYKKIIMQQLSTTFFNQIFE